MSGVQFLRGALRHRILTPAAARLTTPLSHNYPTPYTESLIHARFRWHAIIAARGCTEGVRRAPTVDFVLGAF